VNRNPILIAAIVLIVILGGLTIIVTIRTGPDILTLVSLLVLAMFGFGIVGALRHPPR
jgi:hypothetical protein